jgi:hypothetical protein
VETFVPDAVSAGETRSWALEVAADAAERIRRAVPALRRAPCLEAFAERLVTHLVDGPAGPGHPDDETVSLAREVGAQAAARGGDVRELCAQVRLVAGSVVVRTGDRIEQQGLLGGARAMGRIARAAYAAADRVVDAVTAGHSEARSRMPDRSEEQRRELVDLLLSPRPARSEIEAMARRAGWRLPRTLSVVVLREHGGVGEGRPVFPPEVLPGTHRGAACLVVPDPVAGRGGYDTVLRGRPAVVGPAVGVTDGARSLRWARRAVELLDGGELVAEDRPMRAVDLLPQMLTSWSADLVDLVAAERLAPLATVRPSQRGELEATLLALLKCHFKADRAAEELHVHPQTVRYRLRKLEDLFGPGLYEPEEQLNLHLLLYTRVSGRASAAQRT